MGWDDQLRQTPGFRRMFKRLPRHRLAVRPDPGVRGRLFSYLGWPLDRLYLLEYAARLYDDPTYLDAARRLSSRPQAGLPGVDVWFRGLPLIDLELSHATPRAPQGSPSLVTLRRHGGSDRPLVDKLILRTGREAGSAMILLDLYAAGSHAHTEKGPSVAFYEVDHVPLFHNLGRHRVRSAITGNLPWACPARSVSPAAGTGKTNGSP